MTSGPANGEPGSPLLTVDEDVAAFTTLPDADAVARRIHALRKGQGLDVTAAVASFGDGLFAACVVWAVPRGQPRRFLAAAAGPGVSVPADLLAALHRTAAKPNAAAKAA